MCSCKSADDWRPTASLEVLTLRAELLQRIRRFFQELGFLEVETPLLSADTIVDRHLDPFAVIPGDPGNGHSAAAKPLWLQTSPELGMKRLLAAGAEAIFQIARAFRRGELGRLHNPEFTIVEWYRVGDDTHRAIALLSDLCEVLLHRGAAETITYAEAFERHTGENPHVASVQALRQAAARLDVAVPAGFAEDDRDGWLDLLFCECVQPHLGHQRPAIVCDFPASQAALAQLRHDNPPVAERFELFVDGVELANGYYELTSAEEYRCRVSRQNRWRLCDGKSPLPEHSRLLAAMEHGLPSAAGCALGFDRVVMLAADAGSVAEVMAFPFTRA